MPTRTWGVKHPGSGTRARWTGANGLLAGYCVGAAATTVAVLAGGTRHTVLALALVIVVLLATGSQMTIPLAAATGTMTWLFYDGFVVGKHATLNWHGPVDGWRIGACVAATLVASMLAKARHRPASHPGGNVVSLAAFRQQREARQPATDPRKNLA